MADTNDPAGTARWNVQLDSGELIEVDVDRARAHGFLVPLVLSRAVWNDCVRWGPAERAEKGDLGESEDGRLLRVLRCAERAMRWLRIDDEFRHRALPVPALRRVNFDVHRIPPAGGSLDVDVVRLSLAIDPPARGRPEPAWIVTHPDQAAATPAMSRTGRAAALVNAAERLRLAGIAVDEGVEWLQDLVVAAVGAGMSEEAAALCAKVSRDTVQDWLGAGSTPHSRRD